MRHTEQEILQALKTIKDVCMYQEDHGYKDCSDCPLRVRGSSLCGVTNIIPESWKFCDTDKWSAFDEI